MTLVDRYFETLRVFLPGDDHADVIRELREDIDERVSETEAALGRRLKDAEEAAVLKPLGHPLLLASRYRPQRHLIGPLVFPYYWLALRVALVGVTAVNIIGRDPEGLVVNALSVIGWFTLMAAAAEHWLRRSGTLERWDPLRLAREDWTVARATARREASTPVSLFVGAVLGGWWLLGLKYPQMLLGNGADYMAFGPIVHRWYPLIVAVQLLFFAGHVVNVYRVGWLDGLQQMVQRSWLVMTIRATLAGAFVGFVAFGSHEWVVATGVGGAPAWPLRVAFVNRVISVMVALVAIAAALGTAHDFVRRLRDRSIA
jgi:hypothetical protein